MTVRSHKGLAPQRKVVEEKITSAQRDKFALKLRIKELEGQTMVGWNELISEVPEIEELRSNLVELVFRAQAFPGVQLAYEDEDSKQKPAPSFPSVEPATPIPFREMASPPPMEGLRALIGNTWNGCASKLQASPRTS
jgi:hypothetical protein